MPKVVVDGKRIEADRETVNHLMDTIARHTFGKGGKSVIHKDDDPDITHPGRTIDDVVSEFVFRDGDLERITNWVRVLNEVKRTGRGSLNPKEVRPLVYRVNGFMPSETAFGSNRTSGIILRRSNIDAAIAGLEKCIDSIKNRQAEPSAQ